MRLHPLSLLLFLLIGGAALAAEDASPEAQTEADIDKIIFRSGTVFSGQIVDGTKSLIDDPNRYEILLQNNTILSILDTGQIERVVKDGQTLDDPQKQGGRRKLYEMLQEYQRRKDLESLQQAKVRLGVRVEWLIGDLFKSDGSEGSREVLGTGKTVTPGEDIRVPATSRTLLSLANRVRVGVEQGSHFGIGPITSDPADDLGETFTFEFELFRGAIWVEVKGALGGDKPVNLRTQGLSFSPIEGLYQLRNDGDEVLALVHYTGPDTALIRDSDDERIPFPAESGFQFSTAMLEGKAPFRPRRFAMGDINEWLEFRDWKPVKIDLPVLFSLVGKPRMEPRPIRPLMGLPSEKFVFQDLQPIRTTGMAPLFESYREALKDFVRDVKRPPTEAEGLGVLIQAPEGGIEGWAGPYLPGGELLLDPWGQPPRYSLIQTGAKALINLYSMGANGIDEQGLGDDLR